MPVLLVQTGPFPRVSRIRTRLQNVVFQGYGTANFGMHTSKPAANG